MKKPAQSRAGEKIPRGITMKAKVLIILVLLALFLIIVLQNSEVVTLQLLFWQITISRILLIFIIVFIGFVLGYTVGRTGRHGHAR